MTGICLLNKPAGVSSMQAVAKIRRFFSNNCNYKIKAGHAGTLDPFATGVLPIFTDHLTKFIDLLHLCDKEYIFEIEFGTETNTGDVTGEILQKNQYKPSEKEISNILSEFVGKQKQKPHKFSAVHIDGKRAYDLARNNINFEMPEKEINIFSLECLEYKPETVKLKAKCSTGTYIRSLACDIAEKLNTCACVKTLHRSAYGKITDEDLCQIDNPVLLSHNQLCFLMEGYFQQINLTETEAEKICLGQYCVKEQENGIYLASCNNILIGLVKIENNVLMPQKIMANSLTKDIII